MTDRLSAFGRGAAQGASGGWSDELTAKLLAAIPQDDGTGIPREYAAGSAEQDYKNTERAANTEAARAYPANFGAGAILGAAPAAIASGGAGGLGVVGLGVGQGALTGAGMSENSGKELVKDTIRGGAVGGALGAAGNAAAAAGPAIQKMMQMGPPRGPAPAMAGAGTSAPRQPQVSAPVPGSQMNMAESMSDIPMPSPRPNVPPRRDSLPAMAVPEFPKPGKLPNISDAEMDIAEQRLRQTEQNWAKKHEARFSPEAQKATVRPGKKARAR